MEFHSILDFQPLAERNQWLNVEPNPFFKQKYSMQITMPLTGGQKLWKNHHHSLIVCRNQNDGFIEDQNTKLNELIPGVKFGTFFGSIEQATERLVRSKIVQEKRCNSVDELEIVNQTIKGINKGKEPSISEKELMKQIEEMEQRLKQYEQINPKIRKQNKDLQQANRKLRNQSIVYQNELFRWQKQIKVKNQELKEKDYEQKEFQVKLENIFNKHVHESGREVKITRIK